MFFLNDNMFVGIKIPKLDNLIEFDTDEKLHIIDRDKIEDTKYLFSIFRDIMTMIVKFLTNERVEDRSKQYTPAKVFLSLDNEFNQIFINTTRDTALFTLKELRAYYTTLRELYKYDHIYRRRPLPILLDYDVETFSYSSQEIKHLEKFAIEEVDAYDYSFSNTSHYYTFVHRLYNSSLNVSIENYVNIEYIVTLQALKQIFCWDLNYFNNIKLFNNELHFISDDSTITYGDLDYKKRFLIDLFLSISTQCNILNHTLYCENVFDLSFGTITIKNLSTLYTYDEVKRIFNSFKNVFKKIHFYLEYV